MANYITVSRSVLIFPILYFLSEQNSTSNWIAFCLFLVAGVTDQLDGYIARRTNTVSSLGGLLDLIADKLLVTLSLLYLVSIYDDSSIIIPTMIIVSRELIISSFRQFIVEKHGINPIKVSIIAKSKTTLQITSILFLIISPNFGEFFYSISSILLWLSAYVSVQSLYEYFKSYKNFIK